MIQKARGINSQSLLREAKYAILLLDSEENLDYFQGLLDELVEKRKDPNTHYTGAKSVRQQLLACLRQLGDVKTANIWARNLMMDFDSIQDLREQIAEELSAAGIYGVVEIHPQDREINSPHIQFVGTEAEKAQHIIAQILVNNRYELSMEKAIGKQDYERAFEKDSGAIVVELEDKPEFYKGEKEQEIKDIASSDDELASYIKRMNSLKDEFYKMLAKHDTIAEYDDKEEREDYWRKRELRLRQQEAEQERSLDDMLNDIEIAKAKIRRRNK